MSTTTHADELLLYVAEANLKHATVESLHALVVQTYRATAHELV